ncbi:MAG: threonine dehydrogenase-like Zn-dependent dehydrogenase [Candidatus Latescibacterota bacterium]
MLRTLDFGEEIVKAAQIIAPRLIKVVDADEPQIAGAGQVKIQMERACLCGSDMPYWNYDHNAIVEAGLRDPSNRRLPLIDYKAGDPYPMLVGQSIHECLGTVVESSSDRFKEGDFVLALPEAQAGLCEYMCAPESRTIHLPREGVPSEQILMTQPLGTVVWAVQKLGNLVDQDAVVVGQGPMGLMFTHMLANLGCRTVIALDKLDYRLDAAKQMKATHTINVDQEDAEAIVRDITGGKMADLVVEAVGHQTETINGCMKLIRRMGTLLCFGVPDDVHYPFAFSDFFRLNLSLIASVGPDLIPNFSLARDLISQGRIDVAPLVTHVLPFEEIQRGYELFVDRLDGAIKVVIDYDTLRK